MNAGTLLRAGSPGLVCVDHKKPRFNLFIPNTIIPELNHDCDTISTQAVETLSNGGVYY